MKPVRYFPSENPEAGFQAEQDAIENFHNNRNERKRDKDEVY